MQPYDRERQDAIDEEWAEHDRERQNAIDKWANAEVDRMLALTDDDVRALGLKEYKPGYFWNDPRYPTLSPEERYLYDHPGPDWRTKPQEPSLRDAARALKQKRINLIPDWDESLFSGETMDEWKPPRPVTPKIIPVKAGIQDEFPRRGDRIAGLWACRVCWQKFALWPKERAWRWNLFGVQGTLVFCAPIACTECRVYRQSMVAGMGQEKYRPFWRNIISLWEDETWPTSPKWVGKALFVKARLLSLLRGRNRHSR